LVGRGPGVGLHHLGIVEQLRGRWGQAERWYRRSLTITEELGIRPEMAMTYGQLRP
jgi:hypothetical protein